MQRKEKKKNKKKNLKKLEKPMAFFLILKNDHAMTVDMILMILMEDIKVNITYIFLYTKYIIYN